MKRRMALTLAVAALATVATVALARPSKSRFAAIDRCLASDRAWDYRAGRCLPQPEGPVDRILVDKSDRTLAAYRDGQVIRTFRVALGSGGLEPKQRQGDGRVPEGSYLITYHNAESRFHRSLRISYPTDEQRATAQATGINPGGDIMIHGLPNGMGTLGSRHVLRDWTEGCIAVTNREMDWLFSVVPDGTRIDIDA